MGNELKNAASPHLLHRSSDPVNWHAWSAEAFAEAQRQNKPVLLSIGYSTCHSCHTMGRESFADPETAALMNELFVNIQVDRDLRPDVDEVYQASLKALGNPGGGWPLTMFLTPSGEAFAGGTHFPRDARADRPAFAFVMKTVSEVFHNKPDQVVSNTSQLREHLDRSFARWAPAPGEELRPDVFDLVSIRVGSRFDSFLGGLIGGPKFPNMAMVEQMWRGYCRSFMPQFHHAVETTLRSICDGGIYDHLGGGIFRYATDENWLQPRFEKMLYDNAQLIDVLSLVWQRDHQPLFRKRIEETVGWLLREMLVDGGGFASALDSESEGEEGRYYLWTESEIEAVLGKDAKLFSANYGVVPTGNWEGSNVLHRRGAPPPAPVVEGQLNAMRQRLLEARATRTRPERDDTVLTAWNGLAIAALAKAGEVFNRADWQAAAVKAFWFVNDATGDDTLVRSQRAGHLGGAAFADDYAHMARAALALYETTGHGPYLERALRWVAQLDAHFFSQELHGYCLTSDTADALIVRPRTIHDSVIPSANAVMIEVLSRLAFVTCKDEYRARAKDLIGTFAEDALALPLGAPTFFNALDTYGRGTQIVIVGPANSPRVLAFRDSLRRVSLPEKIVTTVGQPDQLPEGHPLRAANYADNQPSVFICRGGACSRPLTDPGAFELLLKSRTVPAPPVSA